MYVKKIKHFLKLELNSVTFLAAQSLVGFGWADVLGFCLYMGLNGITIGGQHLFKFLAFGC